VNLVVETFPCGPLATNAYLVVDTESRLALVVDAPPDSADTLQQGSQDRSVQVALIVITHTHWDHVVDAARLRRGTGAPLAAHRLAAPRLEHARPLLAELPFPIEPVSPDRLLEDGDLVELGRWRFRVIHTPGHAREQISLYEPETGVLFGGDTLFAGGYGRVDLPGASVEQTVATMRRLLELPDEVTVYPGHGEPTTIGRERPWMTEVASSSRT
jgi:glyoxylase-like metal-dependent hydrolase (beta-lactamase superfamily II)